MLSSLPIDSETHCGRHLSQRDKPLFQRRAYGLRDEEYLRLKVLSCMLPEI